MANYQDNLGLATQKNTFILDCSIDCTYYRLTRHSIVMIVSQRIVEIVHTIIIQLVSVQILSLDGVESFSMFFISCRFQLSSYPVTEKK